MHSQNNEKRTVQLFFENYARQSVVTQAVRELDSLDEEPFRDGVLRLLYHMFLSPFAIRYPPSSSYRLQVLSDLIKTLESGGRREVPDLAYQLHSRLSSADAASSEGHVVYRLPGGVEVAVWENRRMLGAGTTGLRTWQAGKALLEWYLQRPESIQGRRVLELGSGLGLTGLALCRTCRPRSYHITDGHPLVVQRLKYNVEINLGLASENHGMLDEPACAAFVSDPPSEAPSTPLTLEGPGGDSSAPDGDLRVTLDGTELRAGTLDWFEFTAEDAAAMEVDLVLMADVTYAPELHEPLVRTLRLLLECVTPPPEALLALTDRNEATTARLMEELAKQGLRQRLLATPANNQSSFLMEEVTKVKIFSIERATES